MTTTQQHPFTLRIASPHLHASLALEAVYHLPSRLVTPHATVGALRTALAAMLRDIPTQPSFTSLELVFSGRVLADRHENLADTFSLFLPSSSVITMHALLRTPDPVPTPFVSHHCQQHQQHQHQPPLMRLGQPLRATPRFDTPASIAPSSSAPLMNFAMPVQPAAVTVALPPTSIATVSQRRSLPPPAVSISAAEDDHENDDEDYSAYVARYYHDYYTAHVRRAVSIAMSTSAAVRAASSSSATDGAAPLPTPTPTTPLPPQAAAAAADPAAIVPRGGATDARSLVSLVAHILTWYPGAPPDLRARTQALWSAMFGAMRWLVLVRMLAGDLFGADPEDYALVAVLFMTIHLGVYDGMARAVMARIRAVLHPPAAPTPAPAGAGGDNAAAAATAPFQVPPPLAQTSSGILADLWLVAVSFVVTLVPGVHPLDPATNAAEMIAAQQDGGGGGGGGLGGGAEL
ncbi:hypothetical protein BC828DRAFT_402831 [Blastocladiella britannica]|nr:hypothetical protein BC828DRAFT_402831 [Blastocladiella britannica]